MPTLAGLNGRSLNADLSGGLNLLLKTFGTGPEREAKRKAEALLEQQQGLVDIIAQPTGEKASPTQQAVTDVAQAFPGGAAVPDAGTKGPTVQEKQQALVRLTSINPQLAQQVRQTIEFGDKRKEAQIAQEVDKGVKMATLINTAKTFPEKRALLMDIALAKSAAGEDFGRALELRGLPKERLNLEVKRMLLAGDEAKTLLAPKPEVRQVRNTLGVPLAQETVEKDPITGEERVTKVEKSTLAVEPKGDLAILNAQLQAGNISQDQFDQGVKNVKDKQKTSLIKNLEAIDVNIQSPEGKELVKKALLKPRVVIKENEGLFTIPSGYMLRDPNNAPLGIKPIPGGPQDSLKGENAGKAQMLLTAQKAFKGARSLVFKKDKDGKITKNIDTVNLVNAALNTPGTQGRELRQMMEFGIQGITRLETGANMPQEELDNTRERFMPKAIDSPRIVDLKLKMFDDFIGGTLKLLDPTGRFSEERFQAELDERQAGETPQPTGALGVGQSKTMGNITIKRKK